MKYVHERPISVYLDVEALVRDDLIVSLDLNLIEDHDEGGSPMEIDVRLVEALVTAIEYYTCKSEFRNIIEDRREKLKQLGVDIF